MIGQDDPVTELWEYRATELAAMIAAREVTSREVLEAHLRRVENINPHVNAIVGVLAEQGLDAADRADSAVSRGDILGPLHGVPCTVKENIDVAGSATTQGIAALADAIADRDAPSVERLREAGAIPFARTNLPDLGLRVHTDSQLHGLTRNPWDHSVTAGGSSGGEAVALATGMSPLGIGNDIGGSLRNPAHCCGIASHKPTVGVIASATVVPPLDPMLASQLMLVQGPMARTIGDVRAAFDVLAGYDRRDPLSIPARFATVADQMTVAIVENPPGGATDPSIAAAVRHAADILSDLGHDVVTATPPAYEEIFMLWAGILVADLRAQQPLLEAVMGADARTVLQGFIDFVPPATTADLALLYSERHRLMREWSGFFADHRLIVSPTWALRAFEHGADVAEIESGRLLETFRPVLAPNVLGLPASVVPTGIFDGLPVGVQIIGDRFDDLSCLSAAQQIENAVAAFTPITPVWLPSSATTTAHR